MEYAVKGLLLGYANMNENITGTGTYNSPYFGKGAYEEHSNKDQTNQLYGEYTIGNLKIDAEYRRAWRDQQVFNGFFGVTTDTRGAYLSGEYRFSKRFTLGSYYSRLVPVWRENHGSPDNHLYDKVVTARVDINNHIDVKVGGHFMDGYGQPGEYPAGFYTQDNTNGFKPKTNLLVIKTGFNF